MRPSILIIISLIIYCINVSAVKNISSYDKKNIMLMSNTISNKYKIDTTKLSKNIRNSEELDFSKIFKKYDLRGCFSTNETEAIKTIRIQLVNNNSNKSAKKSIIIYINKDNNASVREVIFYNMLAHSSNVIDKRNVFVTEDFLGDEFYSRQKADTNNVRHTVYFKRDNIGVRINGYSNDNLYYFSKDIDDVIKKCSFTKRKSSLK